MLKLGKWGVRSILGLVALVIVVLFSQAISAQAATNYNAKDYTTSASVINGPDFTHADTIQVSYNLAFGDTALKAGDKITVDLPENLRARTVGDVFDVTDEETGQVIGTAEVTSDGQVVLTMNENIEGKKNTEIKLNLATKYRGEDSGEKDVIFDLENGGQSTSTINIIKNEANLSKKGTLDTETGMIKWTILVNRQEVDLKNLTITDTIGDHQELIKDVKVYNGEWSSATTYKRKDQLSSSAYDVNYKENGFDLAFNDTVSNLVVIDYYTKVTDTDLMNDGYHFKNQAIMEWGGGTSGGKNQEEANGKVYDKSYNNGSGTGDLNSSSEPDESSSEVDSSSEPEESSSEVNSSSESESSSSEVSSSSSSTTSSSSSSTTEPDDNGGNQTGEPDDPEDNTDVNPDIDEDTGTVDVDGGFETGTDGTKPAPDANSSSKLTSSVSSVFTSSNRPSTAATAKPTAPATKKSSAKTTVSQANAATPQPRQQRKLPQTNETKTDSQSLRSVGILLAVLTLVGGALLRHWF